MFRNSSFEYQEVIQILYDIENNICECNEIPTYPKGNNVYFNKCAKVKDGYTYNSHSKNTHKNLIRIYKKCETFQRIVYSLQNPKNIDHQPMVILYLGDESVCRRKNIRKLDIKYVIPKPEKKQVKQVIPERTHEIYSIEKHNQLFPEFDIYGVLQMAKQFDYILSIQLVPDLAIIMGHRRMLEGKQISYDTTTFPNLFVSTIGYFENSFIPIAFMIHNNSNEEVHKRFKKIVNQYFIHFDNFEFCRQRLIEWVGYSENSIPKLIFVFKSVQEYILKVSKILPDIKTIMEYNFV